MRAGNGGNFMPDDRAGFLRAWDRGLNYGKAINALGVEMNLGMLVACEAPQQFGKGALRPMTAVNEG